MITTQCKITILSRTRLKYQEGARQPIEGSVDSDPLRQETRQWLAERAARPDESGCLEPEVKLLGRHLYQTLFSGDVLTAFTDLVRDVQADAEKGLCLQLIFHEAAGELARLPWEFLVMDLGNGNDCFLAGEVEQFVLTRFMPSQPAQMFPPLHRPLKVLMAACTGEVTGESDDEFAIEEIRGLVDSLGKHAKPSSSRDSEIDVEVQRTPNPTFAQLRDAIQGKKFTTPEDEPWLPDVVHVIGHGEPGAILLRRAESQVNDDRVVQENERLLGQPVSQVSEDAAVRATTLAQLFKPHRPSLVFLQTCYSDAIDGGDLYATSQRIVSAGVPAVVAMQYDIDRGAADKFAVQVYEDLFEGKSIARAVSAGRQVLRLPDSGAKKPFRAFGTPVIYLGVDGPLLVPPKPRPVQQTGAQASHRDEVRIRTCPRCKTPCRYDNCSECALYFNCTECSAELENPFGAICGKCRTKIKQEPWQSDPSRAQPVAADSATVSFQTAPAHTAPLSLSAGGQAPGTKSNTGDAYGAN
jgi:hypothetical protein